MDLKLDHHTKDGIEIVDVEGEIDVYTAPRLRELLIDLVNNGFYQLVVNMEKVEFLDSTGLGVLVGGLKRVRAHDGSLDLVCTQERILKIFRITGLTKVFGIHETVDEAIAVRKSAQFRSEERVTGAAGRSLEQPPRIPIQIFLQDGEAAYAVEDAIRTVLRDFGVVIVELGSPDHRVLVQKADRPAETRNRLRRCSKGAASNRHAGTGSVPGRNRRYDWRCGRQADYGIAEYQRRCTTGRIGAAREGGGYNSRQAVDSA